VSVDREPLLGTSPTQFGETKLPDSGPQFGTLDAIPAARRSAVGVWLHRLRVLSFVFFCAVLGVVLVVFPWRDEWTNNLLLINYPALQDLLSTGFVRGLCTGLGLLDIWIGFWEAVHYHE
jgi:hypothetical protein